MSVFPEEFVRQFPSLFHMAERGSWSSIEKHGLLSTAMLLERFKISDCRRKELERRPRRRSVDIQHPDFGNAVLRDQKTLSIKKLLGPARDGERVLLDGLAPCEWCKILNSKVFFWLTRERLKKMLSAREYKEKRHLVLTVDTKRLLDTHAQCVRLSPINSGSTLFSPVARGPNTFLPLAEYPIEYWKRKRQSTKNSVVKLTVKNSIPDIRDHVLRVEELGSGESAKIIYHLDSPIPETRRSN